MTDSVRKRPCRPRATVRRLWWWILMINTPNNNHHNHHNHFPGGAAAALQEPIHRRRRVLTPPVEIVVVEPAPSPPGQQGRTRRQSTTTRHDEPPRRFVVKGSHVSQQQQRRLHHRSLGQDKGDQDGDDNDDEGGGKTKPEKGNEDPEDDEPMPTLAPSSRLGSAAPSRAPSTPLVPTAPPTTMDDNDNDNDVPQRVNATSVQITLSIGVAPPSRRRTRTETHARHLTAALQSLVVQVVSQIISSSTSLQVDSSTASTTTTLQQGAYRLLWDANQSHVSSIVLNVDVSWWEHVIVYQLQHVVSSLVQQQQQQQPSLMSIITPLELQVVTQDATDAVEHAMATGRLLTLLRESAPRVLAVSVPGDEENQELWSTGGGTAGKEQPDNNNNNKNNTPTYVDSMSDLWNVRSWVGVGLLVATIVGMLLLMLQARKRGVERAQYQVWGTALGTERGVNDLLNIGWRSKGGEVTAFYDKSKEEYRGDGSTLLGGNQHTAVISSPSSHTAHS